MQKVLRSLGSKMLNFNKINNNKLNFDNKIFLFYVD